MLNLIIKKVTLKVTREVVENGASTFCVCPHFCLFSQFCLCHQLFFLPSTFFAPQPFLCAAEKAEQAKREAAELAKNKVREIVW